jgi:REP element-mobilizing transposase RayT
MRQPRIKIAAEIGEAVYHCMSRTVNGERLFDDVAKEVLRKQFWRVADYCGVQIVTHAILSNHFHVLVRVPQKALIPDNELLRRYTVLYPKPTRFQTARLDVIRSQLAADGPEAVLWRKRQLALMGDVSQFMKLVKQRFSIWFNQSHHRYGTLWSERFKSVLVEPRGHVVQTMAAYIDLNCVRAGLAQDPKDYRFCGYAEAVAGHKGAQRGLMSVAGTQDWTEAQAGYRQVLFGTGAGTPAPATGIHPEDLQIVLKAGGRLPLATVLRCRVRYFNDGAVLGSKAFVAQQLAAYHRHTGKRGQASPRPLPPLTAWDDLTTLRGLRHDGFG